MVFQHRQRSPIAIKDVKFRSVDEKGISRFMYWMKARDVPKYEPSFQKVFFTILMFLLHDLYLNNFYISVYPCLYIRLAIVSFTHIVRFIRILNE